MAGQEVSREKFWSDRHADAQRSKVSKDLSTEAWLGKEGGRCTVSRQVSQYHFFLCQLLRFFNH